MGAHEVLVDTDANTLPDDRHKNASDPPFTIILTWTGNHFEYLATSIDARRKVLETGRNSQLSSLTTFGWLLGDF
jgi:hypothetical protein